MRVYYTDAYALKSPAHQELQTTRSLLQVTPEQVQRCSGAAGFAAALSFTSHGRI